MLKNNKDSIESIVKILDEIASNNSKNVKQLYTDINNIIKNVLNTLNKEKNQKKIIIKIFYH